MEAVKWETKKEQKEREKAEAIAELRELCPPGSRVYCILRHVSKSGMMREISLFVVPPGGSVMQPISWSAARVTGGKLVDRYGHRAIRVGGCGMDMGFHLVYSLSSVLYREGFECIGKGCPSNDHSNRENRKHHPSGGYALRHEWL